MFTFPSLMLNFQINKNKTDQMELEFDTVNDDQVQYPFPVLPGNWHNNASNFLNFPFISHQATNLSFNRPQTPEQLHFPHFSTPSNHITKIQKHIQDSPRNVYDYSNQQYQLHLKQDISPFDPTDFQSPSPQRNRLNSLNNDSELLNCSFGKREAFIRGIDEPNPSLPDDNDTGERSFRNEIDELWKGDSPDSFRRSQNILDLASSLSLNNEEEIEIQGTQDSLILNDLSSILDPLDKDKIVEEDITNISEEFEGELFEKKVRLEKTGFNKRKIEQTAEEKKKDKWEKLPGKIVQGVKKGCQYYYTRTKGIKLGCISRILGNKPIEARKRFENFIGRYKPTGKTWECVVSNIRDGTDEEITYMLTELVYELLSSQEDLEAWMINVKMSKKTRNYIEVKKENLKEKFVQNLLPRG